MLSHLFSLRYHRLHPEYILSRIEKLGHSYDRRFLLILCDIVCLSSLSQLPANFMLRPNIANLYENSQRSATPQCRLTSCIHPDSVMSYQQHHYHSRFLVRLQLVSMKVFPTSPVPEMTKLAITSPCTSNTNLNHRT